MNVMCQAACAGCGVPSAGWTNICKMSQVWWLMMWPSPSRCYPLYHSIIHLPSIYLPPSYLLLSPQQHWVHPVLRTGPIMMCPDLTPAIRSHPSLSRRWRPWNIFHNLMILIIHFTVVQLIEYRGYICHCVTLWHVSVTWVKLSSSGTKDSQVP